MNKITQEPQCDFFCFKNIYEMCNTGSKNNIVVMISCLLEGIPVTMADVTLKQQPTDGCLALCEK